MEECERDIKYYRRSFPANQWEPAVQVHSHDWSSCEIVPRKTILEGTPSHAEQLGIILMAPLPQKELILMSFKSLGYITLMAGNNTNDVGWYTLLLRFSSAVQAIWRRSRNTRGLSAWRMFMRCSWKCARDSTSHYHRYHLFLLQTVRNWWRHTLVRQNNNEVLGKVTHWKGYVGIYTNTVPLPLKRIFFFS